MIINDDDTSRSKKWVDILIFTIVPLNSKIVHMSKTRHAINVARNN